MDVSRCSSFAKCNQQDVTRLSGLRSSPLLVNVQDLSLQDGREVKKFNEWLSDRLHSEKATCIAQIKEILSAALEDQRHSQINELKSHLGSQPAAGLLLNSMFTSDAMPNGCAQDKLDLSASVPKEEKTQMQTQLSSDSGTPSSKNQMRAKLESFHKDGADFDVNHELHPCSVAVQRIVKDTKFEVLSMAVIILNTIFLLVEMQYVGFETGYIIRFEGQSKTEKDIWPFAAAMFLYSAIAFNSFFTIEFAMRLIAMRWQALGNRWIWLDGVLVPMGALDILFALGYMDSLGFDPNVFRVLRLLRLMRLARAMKAKDAFHSLFLLMKSIRACVTALLWSFLLLWFIMIACGMLINQLLYDYFKDSGQPVEERQQVYEYFGTFTRTMLTMFEITFANWITPTRVIMRHVGQGMSTFIVVYRCVFCFAVLNVIRAVFITETNRVANSDDEVALMVREASNKGLNRKLNTLFQALDHSGDGTLDWLDMEQGLKDPVLKSYLALLEIEPGDLENLFHLLDNGDGQVDWKEFSQNVRLLRGQARSLDMINCLASTRRIEEKVQHLLTPQLPRRKISKQGIVK